MKLKPLVAALTAGVILPGVAFATDGYFSHGYGMKAKGMGGVAAAMTESTFGGANNPATMVFAGDRIDVGADWFRPMRSAKREGSSAGGFGFVDASVDGNETNNFVIPEFGYNKMLSPTTSLGVSVYGNGGMNTDYRDGKVDQGICTVGVPNGVLANNLLCGTGNLGVDLSQLIIAPTLAWKFAPNHSVGVSALVGYQRFKAYGLQPFAAISSDPSNLRNKGYDSAWGFGVRIGYYGKINDMVSVGAAYSSKVRMGEFDKYRGLFAGKGDFDIPENLSIGVAFRPMSALTIAADYQRINYSGIDSVGNSSRQSNCAPTFPAGPGVGPDCLGAGGSSIGFGWRDIDVWKLGIEYAYSPALTLRAGYNHSDQPISSQDVTFNILAPGVVQDHVSLGFTYSLGQSGEVTVAYMHAFEESVSGPATNPHFLVGGTETIKMYQDSLGIAWGKKF